MLGALSMPPTAPWRRQVPSNRSLPLEAIEVEPVDSQDFRPEPYPRQRHVPPPITGEDAIAEAARINRKLSIYDRKALPPRRY